MKIALLSNEYPPETAFGGISTYVSYLARGLVQGGHEVTVVSLSLDGDKEGDDEGVRVIRLARPSWPLLSAFGWEWRAAERLERLVREEAYEIIEAPAWTGQAFFYRRRFGAPLILRLMTPYPKATEFGSRPGLLRRVKTSFMERHTLGKATLLLSLSKSIGDEYVKLYGVDPTKIRLAPIGIPQPKNLDIKTDPNLILFLGRLEPRKGVDLLIQAMPAVWSAVPSARLTLVGKDQPLAPNGVTYGAWVKEMFSAEEVSKILFTGFVSDQEREKYLARCALLVAPSRYESFGLIYLEAMSYGKPVIATHNGGADSIISDGENGFLSDLLSTSLAENIIRMLTDKMLAHSMGQKSQEIFNSKFTTTKMVDTTLKYYQEALRK